MFKTQSTPASRSWSLTRSTISTLSVVVLHLLLLVHARWHPEAAILHALHILVRKAVERDAVHLLRAHLWWHLTHLAHLQTHLAHLRHQRVWNRLAYTHHDWLTVHVLVEWASCHACWVSVLVSGRWHANLSIVASHWGHCWWWAWTARYIWYLHHGYRAYWQTAWWSVAIWRIAGHARTLTIGALHAEVVALLSHDWKVLLWHLLLLRSW